MITMGTKANSRVLTRDELLSHDPCDFYADRFFERFPESVEITVELAVSQASDWDWCWAASELLINQDSWDRAEDTIQDSYSAVMTPYWDLTSAAYRIGEAAYQAELSKQRAEGVGWPDCYNKADEVFVEATKVARAAAEAADGVARKDRDEALARAFAEQYIAEGNN
jgi:hypothetical protein